MKTIFRDKISTGISYFDELCNGGFNKKSINLLVGSAGSGKTIFAINFLIKGILDGENVLYITFEEKKEELYADMLVFGWDLKSYEVKGNFTFMEYSPEKVKHMLDEGGGFLEDMIKRKNISRLVIDSITSFTLLFENELLKKKTALALFEVIKRWNITSLLTLQKGLTENDLHAVVNGGDLEFEADTIIYLYLLRFKKERRRFIEILKMRGSDHSDKIHEVKIKKGFLISKKPVILEK
jgi:circadian clock protein KaiC